MTARPGGQDWLSDIALKGSYGAYLLFNVKFFIVLQSITCRVGSHSVVCHVTEMNVPSLNPKQDHVPINGNCPIGAFGPLPFDTFF